MGDKVTVNVRELRDNLASYLTQAEKGDEVIVTSHGKAIVKIVSAGFRKPRTSLLGAMSGRIVMAPDFDETPADIIDAMEGRNEA